MKGQLVLAGDHERAEQMVPCTDASCSPQLALLRCFLVNELIGIRAELEHGQALVIIATATMSGRMFVEADVGVGDPLNSPALGNWLELQ